MSFLFICYVNIFRYSIISKEYFNCRILFLGVIKVDYINNYNFWLKNVKDKELHLQLTKMANDENAIKNAFYKDLEFGTAGLRGLIGVGSNCLNIYTIMRTTLGLGQYMLKGNKHKVAISYDSRIKSKLFAHTASRVLNSLGINTYIVDECMPTPFCSYMVRYYKCDFGIMITASHNPKAYNGYKVYGEDGTQLLEQPSLEISKLIQVINPFNIKTHSFEYYYKQKQVKFVDNDCKEQYLKQVKKQSITKMQPLNVVYTPLNGTGYKLVPTILEQCGLNVNIVEQQGYPNGNFTTCPKPNPERADAFKLAIKLGKKVNADILLATDPDCDRVGVAVLDKGEYTLLTGNETGVLLSDYILSQKQKLGELTKNSTIIKSIVTTSMVEKLVNDYNAKCVNVLTGFKYIGNYITKLEKQHRENEFLLGFEESYGYLCGTYVRDKDAVVASMLICEMASNLKCQGATLLQRLNQLYEKYGYYKHKIFTFEFAGAEGNTKMKKILCELRSKPFEKISNYKVINFIDYQSQNQFDLPKTNMMQFDLDNSGRIIVRPSGTEPLIKVYVTLSKTPQQNQQDLEQIKKFLSEYFV